MSVYGKQSEKDATLEGLRAARSFLQRLISDELDLRRTPMLEFVYDGTIDQGMHIQAILRSTGAEELGPIEEPQDEDPMRAVARGRRAAMSGRGRPASPAEMAERLRDEDAGAGGHARSSRW